VTVSITGDTRALRLVDGNVFQEEEKGFKLQLSVIRKFLISRGRDRPR